MKFKDLKLKSASELSGLLAEKREALRVMRFRVEQRQLKKVHDIKNTRHLIARILTLLRQKNTQNTESTENTGNTGSTGSTGSTENIKTQKI